MKVTEHVQIPYTLDLTTEDVRRDNVDKLCVRVQTPMRLCRHTRTPASPDGPPSASLGSTPTCAPIIYFSSSHVDVMSCLRKVLGA